MKSQRLLSSKLAIFTIFLILFVLLSTSAFAQSTSSYQPSPAEIAKYGPGFPAYCSAYSSRPECVVIYGNPTITPPCTPYSARPECAHLYPIPVEPDPCYLTGGYQQGCVPVQQYPCLPGDPSPNCLPSYPPVVYPQPYPIPVPPPIVCAHGYAYSEYHSQCLPHDRPPPSVYDFRHPTPPPSPSCQSGYSPHCLAIAPIKSFHHGYAISPAIPSYQVGENLEYRVNSPYSGYLYVFVEEADGTVKALYPNAYTGDPMYVHTGSVVDLPGSSANYSLGITAPYGLHKLHLVVTSNTLNRQLVDGVRYPYELDNLLLDAGLSQGIYHGYSESAFQVVY